LVMSLFALAVSVRCSPVRESEIKCEEAVAHLDDCCPGGGWLVEANCTFVDDEGCDEGHEPGLTIAESDCVRARDCATLVNSGICNRAKRAHARPIRSEPAGICP
jgi:hypothetical protein